MTTPLSEMQFEILPSIDADEGVVFGIGADVSVDDGGFLPGDDEWQDQDEDNPRRSATAFGRDVLQGPSWGWNLHVNRSDVATAKTTLAEFRTAWRALHIRDTPGMVLPIRYRLNNEYRRIFGRPRRFSAPPDNLIISGYIPITVDFKAADAFIYDDVEQALVLGLAAGEPSGFTFPVTFPVTTLPVGESEQQAVVGGDARTYPVIRFNGPVTNPELTCAAWTIKLSRSIAADEYVEIDLRPWKTSIMLNGTASVAGDLGRRVYLEDIKFEPGRHDLTYRGAAGSGDSTCEVRWANAWNSI